MDPTPLQVYPAMTWPVQKICTQQSPDVVQDPWVAGRVKTMTAVIDPDAIDLEAAGISSNSIILLKHRHS